MVATFLRMAGLDLQHQLLRLKAQAIDLKDQAIADAKRQAVSVGVTLGLVFAGLIFAVSTVMVGLVALYVWIEPQEGPRVAFGAVALSTTLAAMLLFIIAAGRGRSKRPRTASKSVPRAEREVLFDPSLGSRVGHQIADGAATATRDTLNSAADAIRKAPRDTILATLATAVVIGIIFGRRR